MSFGYSTSDSSSVFHWCTKSGENAAMPQRAFGLSPQELWAFNPFSRTCRRRLLNDHEPNQSNMSELLKFINGCNDVLQELRDLPIKITQS